MSAPFSTKLSPEDFKFSILEEAHRLRHHALAQSGGVQLDRDTSMWVIRMEGWREFLKAADFLSYFNPGSPQRRKELLGLPVRLTIDDDEATPMIQLVMEAKIAPP